MTIIEAVAQIDAGKQSIPSNPLANTGLSDAVTWREVREWLTTLGDSEPLARVASLAEEWEAEGEQSMAAAKQIPNEDVAAMLLMDGATMVENARHIRNAIAGTK